MNGNINKGRVGLLVAALRSGLYAKGPGSLHKYSEQADNPFAGTWCCLGVAGDVARRFGLQVTSSASHFGPGTYCEKIDYSTAYLGEHVADWYGFEGEDLVLIEPDGSRTEASIWNDRASSTFEDIAQGFERTFLQD